MSSSVSLGEAAIAPPSDEPHPGSPSWSLLLATKQQPSGETERDPPGAPPSSESIFSTTLFISSNISFSLMKMQEFKRRAHPSRTAPRKTFRRGSTFPPRGICFRNSAHAYASSRFGNCLVAAATSMAGSWAAGETLQRDKPIPARPSRPFLIAAFGNGYNDVCDLPADHVNRPDRVLPRGDISQILALRIAGWCLILGLMAACGRPTSTRSSSRSPSSTALFPLRPRFEVTPARRQRRRRGHLLAPRSHLGAQAGREWNRQVHRPHGVRIPAHVRPRTLQGRRGRRGRQGHGGSHVSHPLRPPQVGHDRLASFGLHGELRPVPHILLHGPTGVAPTSRASCSRQGCWVWTGIVSLATRDTAGWHRRATEMKVWIVLGVVWVLLWRIPV